jgi:hypothetical protein
MVGLTSGAGGQGVIYPARALQLDRAPATYMRLIWRAMAGKFAAPRSVRSGHQGRKPPVHETVFNLDLSDAQINEAFLNLMARSGKNFALAGVMLVAAVLLPRCTWAATLWTWARSAARLPMAWSETRSTPIKAGAVSVF